MCHCSDFVGLELLRATKEKCELTSVERASEYRRVEDGHLVLPGAVLVRACCLGSGYAPASATGLPSAETASGRGVRGCPN